MAILIEAMDEAMWSDAGIGASPLGSTGRSDAWCARVGADRVGIVALVDLDDGAAGLRLWLEPASTRSAADLLIATGLDHAAARGYDVVYLAPPSVDDDSAGDRHGFAPISTDEVPPSFAVLAGPVTVWRRILRSAVPEHRLQLALLDTVLAVCRLDQDAPVPDWASGGELMSITRTRAELSIVCVEAQVPADVTCVRGWRALAVDGPLDFAMVGVLASLVEPLQRRRISVLAIGTYDTDYVLVRASDLEPAIAVLRAAGHTVRVS